MSFAGGRWRWCAPRGRSASEMLTRSPRGGGSVSDLRNGGARVGAVHQDGADDVAPDEGIEILEAGATRQFVHLGQGRHRYGERRSTALWAQQLEATRLVVHAATSLSSVRDYSARVYGPCHPGFCPVECASLRSCC